jgi:hypothetical protein
MTNTIDLKRVESYILRHKQRLATESSHDGYTTPIKNLMEPSAMYSDLNGSEAPNTNNRRNPYERPSLRLDSGTIKHKPSKSMMISPHVDSSNKRGGYGSVMATTKMHPKHATFETPKQHENIIKVKE